MLELQIYKFVASMGLLLLFFTVKEYPAKTLASFKQ